MNLSQVASFEYVLNIHMPIHFGGCKVVSVGKAQSHNQERQCFQSNPAFAKS